MSDTATPVSRMELARDLFFNEGRLPDGWIAPHITRSWERARNVRSHEGTVAPLVATLLRDRKDAHRLLLNSAQPELDALAEHAIGNGCVVIVTDASGVILEEIGAPDFLPKAQRVALLPGVEWSEQQCGTNAIGTVLIEREALAVLGGEHFLPAHGALGCAAAPIFTGRGAIAGVLDVSGDAVRIDGHTLSMVRIASQQIEHRLLLARAEGHVVRFHANSAVLGSAREGVMTVVDGHIVSVNRIGLMLLGQRWDTMLDVPVARVLGRGWNRIGKHSNIVTLADGQAMTINVERAHARVDIAISARTVDSSRATPVAPKSLASKSHTDDSESLVTRTARVLDAGVSVLISGETGVGKEVFAKRLHSASARRGGAMIAVNCAALPESLIEAELFGYEEGAFTGARRRGMLGRIREADGGVLFLDEIGDMPLALQTRLLRALEERVVSPLGGGREVAVDFQLICATHCDLPDLVAQGEFRADLLYRVNGYEVKLPRLRDRGDRRVLIEKVLQDVGAADRHMVATQDFIDALEAYAWPGNVRELVSTLRTVVAIADDGAMLTVASLPLQVRDAASLPASAIPHAVALESSALADIADSAIEHALQVARGNVSLAAKQLGVHRSTIYRHKARRLM